MSKKMIKKEKKPPISDIDDHIRNTFEIKKVNQYIYLSEKNHIIVYQFIY